jgi:hypothetical protein
MIPKFFAVHDDAASRGPRFEYDLSVHGAKRRSGERDACGKRTDEIAFCIFFLTFFAKNLIYGSHCDFRVAKFDVRENQSMKSATKKAAPKKKVAPKKKK